MGPKETKAKEEREMSVRPHTPEPWRSAGKDSEMSGHTPAPWHLNITDQAVYVCAWPDETGESVLARLPRDPEEELDFGAAYHCEEAVENARLIAAAPKLLEALKLIAEDPLCQYDKSIPRSVAGMEYDFGVCQGHRSAAGIASDALAQYERAKVE